MSIMPIKFIDLDGAKSCEPGKKIGDIQTSTNGDNDLLKSWEWVGKLDR